MTKTTKKAGRALAMFLAAFTAAAPMSASAQGIDFALGAITIKQEFATQVAEDSEQNEAAVLATSTDEPSEPAVEVTPTEPQPVIVVVEPGDTLGGIAQAHETSWKRLFDANTSIADPNIINPGDQIRIPEPDEVIAERPLPAAPAPKPAAPARAAARPRAAARIADDGSVWYRLAQCESGGRPNVVSANGKYHGLYQFLPSTWRAVGGSGLPSQASPEEQTMRAQMLQKRSGWGQWPQCARKLGLL